MTFAHIIFATQGVPSMGVVTFMHGRWVWLPIYPLQEAVFNGTSTVGPESGACSLSAVGALQVDCPTEIGNRQLIGVPMQSAI